jgi:hypothetical protein
MIRFHGHLRHVVWWTALTVLIGAAPGFAESVPGEEGPARAAALDVAIAEPAPTRSEGRGPYQDLVISNVMLINGEGAPPRGPVNIHISDDTITRISSAEPVASDDAVEVLDAGGMYALPGFIDAHGHIGTIGQGLTGPLTPPEYIFKLWLGHGITTVREVGAGMGLEWTLAHKTRSEQGEIAAPRLVVHAMFPGSAITEPAAARRWVRSVHSKGADGVKLRGGRGEALVAVMEETQKLGMGTSHHHDQTAVFKVNALDSARMGLDSMEHWYGLPEAMFEDRLIQDYPPGYNYSDEQWRFAQAGRLWQQAAAPGTDKWRAVRDELIDLDFTLVPTFTIYEANRDVARARDAEWHDEYTWPPLARFYLPDPRLHGSYHFDWTTADEVAWRHNFRLWMRFVNDYKNHGGRVAAGSDAGFIFKLFGFAYVRELEMLQEAGFHPLEVVQAATANGARLVGLEDQIGSLVPGKKADIVLVAENPLRNFKVLYGTGHMKLNRQSGELERVGGVNYTIRGGIVYDAKALLGDVRAMVAAQRQREATGPSTNQQTDSTENN